MKCEIRKINPYKTTKEGVGVSIGGGGEFQRIKVSIKVHTFSQLHKIKYFITYKQ